MLFTIANVRIMLENLLKPWFKLLDGVEYTRQIIRWCTELGLEKWQNYLNVRRSVLLQAIGCKREHDLLAVTNSAQDVWPFSRMFRPPFNRETETS